MRDSFFFSKMLWISVAYQKAHETVLIYRLLSTSYQTHLFASVRQAKILLEEMSQPHFCISKNRSTVKVILQHRTTFRIYPRYQPKCSRYDRKNRLWQEVLPVAILTVNATVILTPHILFLFVFNCEVTFRAYFR